MPIPGGLRWNCIHLRDSLRLAQTFVVSEEECAILHDRPPDGSTKLIPMERGLCRVEEIPGVEHAVPDVFKCISVEILGPRACGSANNPARRAPELRRVVARKNGELLNSIGPEIDPQRASRRAIHVVIDADAVQPGIVLPRAAPGYCHLVTETPLCLSGRLRPRTGYSRLQGCQIRGRTPIERQIGHALGTSA